MDKDDSCEMAEYRCIDESCMNICDQNPDTHKHCQFKFFCKFDNEICKMKGNAFLGKATGTCNQHIEKSIVNEKTREKEKLSRLLDDIDYMREIIINKLAEIEILFEAYGVKK